MIAPARCVVVVIFGGDFEAPQILIVTSIDTKSCDDNLWKTILIFAILTVTQRCQSVSILLTTTLSKPNEALRKIQNRAVGGRSAKLACVGLASFHVYICYPPIIDAILLRNYNRVDSYPAHAYTFSADYYYCYCCIIVVEVIIH